ncbi:MAG TPA: VWA domain-containing protein [Thermoanaerobaculia bacterium]|nr:VWA domain-containing protein [Thermoanaerobaculia bacterium]
MLSQRQSVLLAAFLFLPLNPASAQPEPGAFELLAKARQAYAQLPSYRDHGEIETTLSAGVTVRHRFELTAAPGAFRFLLERDLGGEPQRRMIWRSGGEAFHFDSCLGQYKTVASLTDEVAGALGSGGADALVVPITLVGGAGALADPEVATVEGEEPCGDGSCWIVFFSRATDVESRLWIDSRSFLIRQVEVRLQDTGDVVDQAMAQAGLAVRGTAPGAARGTITIRVRHEIEAGKPVQRAEAAFGPPPGARRVTEWQVAGDDELPQFGEEITVAIAAVTVRVVDNHGRPVEGLAPGDFRVLAKGKEIPVVAVDWVSSARTEAPLDPDGSAVSSGPSAPAPSGEQPCKRVVFFVQSGNHPTRLKGQMRLRPHTRELLESFPAADRLAVVSYDSHLKLWQDFTDDREAVFQAIDQAMLFGGDRQTVVRPSRDRSSLAAHLDFDAALRTASPERALQVTAEALQPLPGEKVMIYVGWGLGRFGSDGVRMTPDYRPAIEALDAARVTVFVLDITDADYHSLETGLQSVAYQTGGSYAKTHIFPQHATDFLAGTVSGHYVLTLDRTALPPQGSRVRIHLRDKKGTVYYARPDPVPGVGDTGR